MLESTGRRNVGHKNVRALRMVADSCESAAARVVRQARWWYVYCQGALRTGVGHSEPLYILYHGYDKIAISYELIIWPRETTLVIE